MRRLLQSAARWLPMLALALCATLLASEALAQSTGGSFGGGSFGGGGGGGGGGSYGGGGDDGGGDLLTFIVYVLFSGLPTPLKIGLVVLAIGVWGGFKLFKHRGRKNDPPEDQ